MEISNLYLENYRGAQSLQFLINQRLNVFCGVNGSGKSTVLDSIATLLSWAVSRIRHAGAAGRHIGDMDIRNGESVAKIKLSIEDEGKSFSWQLLKNRKGVKATNEKSYLKELNQFALSLQASSGALTEKMSFPVFAYYPVNRAVLDIPIRIKAKHDFSPFAAYEDALTSGASFRTFFEWFRGREDLENENRKYVDAPDKPDDFQFPDPQLETVRKALYLLLPEFSQFSIRRSPLRMEVLKNKERFTVNQLSDGEKCLIALVGDLARRMAIANPVMDDPLQGNGIIIIDEIDLHLHPQWQRMIIPKLMEVFPNCQFIVSTHSPHIITHVHPKSLFLLKQTSNGLIAKKPHESYGKNVDRIWEDLMGLSTTRPNQVDGNLHKVFLSIRNNDLQGAAQQIARLKQEIGDDPELVKAEVLIKRREIIGK